MWATSRALQGSQLLQSSPLTALSQPASVLPHRPCSQNPGSAHKTVLQALQRSGTGGHARAAGHAGNAPGMAARKLKQPTGSTSPQDSAEREALKALQQALDKVKGHGQNAGRSSTNTNTHELAYAGAQASGPQSSNTSAAKLMVQYLAELNSGVPQQQALSIYEDWPKVLNALVTLRLHDAQLLRQAEQAVLAACSQGSKVGLRPAARMLRCWARLGQAPSDTTLWALLGSVRGTLQEAEQEATRLMQQGPTQSPPAASRGTQPLQNHQQKSKGQSGARYKNSGGSSGSNTSMGGARPGVQGEGQVVRLEAGARALVELADALAQLLAPEPGTLSRGEPAVPVGWPLSSPPGAATAGSAPAGLKALPALALQMAQRSAAAGPPTPAQLMLAAAAAKAAERAPAAAAPAGVAGPLGATSPAAASASLARTVSSGNAKQASPAPSQPAAAVADGRSVPSLPPVSQAHLALSDWVTDLEACSLAHMRALNGAGLASLLSSLAALGARPSRAWLCAALRQLLHLRLHEDPGEGALHAVSEWLVATAWVIWLGPYELCSSCVACLNRLPPTIPHLRLTDATHASPAHAHVLSTCALYTCVPLQVRTVRLASFCEAVEALGVLHLGGCHAVAVTAAQARAAEAGWPGHAAPKDQRSRSRSGEGQSRQQVHQPEAAGREKQQEHAGASLEEGIRADVEALQQVGKKRVEWGVLPWRLECMHALPLPCILPTSAP